MNKNIESYAKLLLKNIDAKFNKVDYSSSEFKNLSAIEKAEIYFDKMEFEKAYEVVKNAYESGEDCEGVDDHVLDSYKYYVDLMDNSYDFRNAVINYRYEEYDKATTDFNRAQNNEDIDCYNFIKKVKNDKNMAEARENYESGLVWLIMGKYSSGLIFLHEACTKGLDCYDEIRIIEDYQEEENSK